MLKSSTIGADNHPIRSPEHSVSKRSTDNVKISGFYNATDRTRFIELMLVNDVEEFKDYKQNKQTLVDRNRQIANHVNQVNLDFQAIDFSQCWGNVHFY